MNKFILITFVFLTSTTSYSGTLLHTIQDIAGVQKSAPYERFMKEVESGSSVLTCKLDFDEIEAKVIELNSDDPCYKRTIEKFFKFDTSEECIKVKKQRSERHQDREGLLLCQL